MACRGGMARQGSWSYVVLNFHYNRCNVQHTPPLIEGMKTTSIETVSTGVLDTNKED